jgi:hypothetical protein
MSTEKRVFEGVASTVDYEIMNEPCLRDEHGIIDTCAFEWLKGLLGKYLRITVEILPATPEPANPSLPSGPRDVYQCVGTRRCGDRCEVGIPRYASLPNVPCLFDGKGGRNAVWRIKSINEEAEVMKR